MSIKSIKFDSLVTGDVIQRKDHVLYFLTSTNSWGEGGWSCSMIQEISDTWDEHHDLQECTKREVGSIMTREINYVTYHGLVIANPSEGYTKETYHLLAKAFSDLEEKIGDEYVRPVKSVPLGLGNMRLSESGKVGRIRTLLAFQANSELEFDLFSEVS